MFKIEPLKPSDLPQVIEIERQSFPDPWGSEIIRRKYSANPSSFRAIKDKNSIVGFYCAEERQTTNTKCEKEVVALLSTIAVDVEHRQKGIGLILLIDAVKYLQKISKKRIVLHTRIDNEAMIMLAQRAGFRMIGIVPDFYNTPGFHHYESTRDAYEFEYFK